MERRKDSQKTRPREASPEEKLDISDEALEEKMGKEKAAEERRKTYRRESDRLLEEEKNNAEQECARLREEMNTQKDTMLRRQADFENYKKRVSKQYTENRVMTIRDFAGDIIAINDDLIRAVEASESISGEIPAEEAHRSFVEGVSMISRRIEEAMRNYGVTEIEAQDRPFDPNFHEAVEIETSNDVEFDTVTKVYQKGFRIDDLVVRSARVRVAKPNREESDGNGSTGNEEGGASAH